MSRLRQEIIPASIQYNKDGYRCVPRPSGSFVFPTMPPRQMRSMRYRLEIKSVLYSFVLPSSSRACVFLRLRLSLWLPWSSRVRCRIEAWKINDAIWKLCSRRARTRYRSTHTRTKKKKKRGERTKVKTRTKNKRRTDNFFVSDYTSTSGWVNWWVRRGMRREENAFIDRYWLCQVGLNQ